MSMNVWKNKKNCFTHAGFITCSVSAVTQSICCYGRNVCHNSITQSHRCQLLLTRFDSGISVSAYKQGRILNGPQLLCWWGSHNCFASETSEDQERPSNQLYTQNRPSSILLHPEGSPAVHNLPSLVCCAVMSCCSTEGNLFPSAFQVRRANSIYQQPDSLGGHITERVYSHSVFFIFHPAFGWNEYPDWISVCVHSTTRCLLPCKMIPRTYQRRRSPCPSCRTAERQLWTGRPGHTGQTRRPKTPGRRSVCLEDKDNMTVITAYSCYFFFYQVKKKNSFRWKFFFTRAAWSRIYTIRNLFNYTFTQNTYILQGFSPGLLTMT